MFACIIIMYGYILMVQIIDDAVAQISKATQSLVDTSVYVGQK